MDQEVGLFLCFVDETLRLTTMKPGPPGSSASLLLTITSEQQQPCGIFSLSLPAAQYMAASRKVS